MVHEKPGELEPIADLAHAIWADWMRYLFASCEHDEAGNVLIPAALVRRWYRQMETPYAALADGEQESDRQIARRYWDAVIAVLTARLEQYGKASWRA